MGVTFLDDSRQRYGNWLYDFKSGAYSRSLNSIISGTGPSVDVFQVAIAKGDTDPVIFATYRTSGTGQIFSDERIAVIQGGQLLEAGFTDVNRR